MAYEWIVDGLDETWRSINELVGSLLPAQFDAATACPGWTVRDVLSHLIGFELMVQGVVPPTPTGAYGPHVKNPIGELNEAFVDQRRDRSGAQVRQEFRDVSSRSLSILRAKSDDEWEIVGWSPEGNVPFHRFQETRLLDSWIHLQDLRDALLEPQDDHGVGEEVVVNRFEAAIPYVVGRRVNAPDDTTVRFNLLGRLARTISVRVVNGRAVAMGTLQEAPTVEITTPVALFWRRAAGRITGEAFLAASATQVRGSYALANQIAQQMAIMI